MLCGAWARHCLHQMRLPFFARHLSILRLIDWQRLMIVDWEMLSHALLIASISSGIVCGRLTFCVKRSITTFADELRCFSHILSVYQFCDTEILRCPDYFSKIEKQEFCFRQKNKTAISGEFFMLYPSLKYTGAFGFLSIKKFQELQKFACPDYFREVVQLCYLEFRHTDGVLDIITA